MKLHSNAVAAIAFALLLPAVPSLVETDQGLAADPLDVPAAGPRTVTAPAPATLQGFQWAFTEDMDVDGDRLDDLIERVAEGGVVTLSRQADGFLPYHAEEGEAGTLLGLYVAVDGGVAPSDLAAVKGLGLADPILDDLLPGFWITGASPSQAAALATLPGVVFVQLAHQYRITNTMGQGANRVADSTTYTRGVWEDLGYFGADIGVAILDTGSDDEHVSLGAGRFVAGVSTAYSCGLAGVEMNPDDDNAVSVALIGAGVLTFHGTHVAATAVGDGGGGPTTPTTLAGMAPAADLYEGKVLTAPGLGCISAVGAGLNWVFNFNNGNTLWKSTLGVPASKRIHVASLSLGGGCSNGGDVDSQRVDFLSNTGGVSVMVATGNNALTGCITSPSAAAAAISVGAYNDGSTFTRSNDVVAPFSNCGPNGATLANKKPDVTAPGVDIASASGNAVPGVGLNSYQSLSGTSMATPMVSGIGALILDANPTLTPAQVKQILRETAEPKNTGARGAQDAADPKYHTCWGWGQVDAYGAVKRAEDLLSGSATGPAGSVTGGSSASFTTSMDYTRTEFTQYGPQATGTAGTADEVKLKLTFPSGWSGFSVSSTASNVDSAYSSLVSATTANSIAGTVVTVTFSFTGNPDLGTVDIDDAEATPTITVSATAPSTAGTYTVQAAYDINGIVGAGDTVAVTVT